ncbi:type III secretion system inner membrane ring lipoprotein SctJ [Robbsia andropogonis]|nr:type III secretion inner membrane ring lipoprotein SctJ [Robbsia andropogonis]MCP1117112.1 type III secretion inner membrane ring lipoprotein SctJ [Robbsia andropogonis]MCP1128458.1 type III secretion inner membrane ring lipoprotein SctJ [Robbsia andropogonis]
MMRAGCMGAVLLCLLLAACNSRVELMSTVPEDEANDIMSTLLSDGVQVTKTVVKGGSSLSVPSDQVAVALEVMRAHGLPRERFTGIGNVFRKEGLVSSALEERARYVFALSQELGQTLSQIDGVVSARVHVVLPERGGINEVATQASASVFIKHKAGVSLDALMPQIRTMVANGIPGLSVARVTVFMVPAQAVPHGDAVPWVRVAGWHVAPNSVSGLRIVIGVTCALALAMAAGLAGMGWWTWRMRASLRDAIAASGASSPPAAKSPGLMAVPGGQAAVGPGTEEAGDERANPR